MQSRPSYDTTVSRSLERGKREPLLLLGRTEVAALLDEAGAFAAVERAFLLLGRGEARPPVSCGLPVPDGGFHVKMGGLAVGPRTYVASKTNANVPENPRRRGLPTIQGVVVLFDAESGVPLALLDSGEITTRRTAAATAVAARWLARPGAETLLVWGCGTQGRAHARALARVLPLVRIRLFDRDPAAVERAAAELGRDLGVPVEAVGDGAAAAAASDVVVTCTPSRDFLLDGGIVRPGTLVAGVGADSPEKRELAPSLLARAAVVVDSLEACAKSGDLHHALVAGVIRVEDVRAELAEVVAGARPGRERDDEVVVFDSTGMAIQDVAAAARVYERARTGGIGMEVELFTPSS